MTLNARQFANQAWAIASKIDREDDWCGEATSAVSDHLIKQGYTEHAEVQSSGGDDSGFTYGDHPHDHDYSHSWLEFPDGSILDPTISQFKGKGKSPMTETWPGTSRVAVVPPGHPFARRYGKGDSYYRGGVSR